MLSDATPIAGLPAPYDLLGAILQDGTKEWRWEIDPDLPDEAVVWQPKPGLHSIGGCILHIAAVEVYWFERFVLGRPGDPEERKLLLAVETDVDAWSWPDPPRQPLRWYFDLHDRIRARILEGIKVWPAPDTLITRGERQATARWVFGHVIQHEAYHGGQAVLLMRLWQLAKGA